MKTMRQKDDLSLNFYLLRCLVALVDHSQVTRAADALDISQPAMSRAMSQLRQLTSDPILVKAQVGLVPTAKAMQLREFALRILHEMDQLLGQAIAFDPETARRNFRVVATDYLECVFMDPLVTRLAQNYPGISVSVCHPVHPRNLNQVLESGEADFCVGMLPPAVEDLRHRVIFRDRVTCIAANGHAAVGQTLSPEAFAALDHVVIKPTVHAFGDAVDKALSQLGLARHIRLTTPSYLSVPYLIEKTGMVALMPESLAQRFCERFALATVEVPIELPPYDVYLYWHERTHHHRDHIWFKEQVMLDLKSAG
jgi:DNA-binding transcriptional LysR family regulator